MRAWLLLLALALSGCLGDDASQEPDSEAPIAGGPEADAPGHAPGNAPNDGPGETSDADEVDPGPPGPGEGKERTYACAVTLGAPSGITVDLNGEVTLGACDLVTTSDWTVVVAVTPAASCSINASQGEELPDGANFRAACSEGALQAESSITLRTWT